jgi:hypothetical protein
MTLNVMITSGCMLVSSLQTPLRPDCMSPVMRRERTVRKCWSAILIASAATAHSTEVWNDVGLAASAVAFFAASATASPMSITIEEVQAPILPRALSLLEDNTTMVRFHVLNGNEASEDDDAAMN